jgi:hypothetical protein
MTPWTAASDQIEIVSSNAAAVGYPVGSFAGTDLTANATAESYVNDWRYDPLTLIDASKGDVTHFHQLATKSAIVGTTTYPYIAVDRFWSTNAFTVVDGVASSLSIPFQPVTATGPVDVDWRGSQFEAHLADLGPAAVPWQASFTIGGSPRGDGLPFVTAAYGGWPDLLVLFIPSPGSDVNFGTLTYGKFLPPPWSDFATGGYTARVSVTAAGSSKPADLSVGMSFTEPVGTTPGPILPRLTPVRSITVNGQAGFGTLTGVGLTPTVAWTLPAISPGPPTYRVSVRRLDLGFGSITRPVIVATGWTANTSFQIPAGILEAGRQYVIVVSASWEPGIVHESQPFRAKLPSLWSSSVTSVFTP